MSMTHVDARTYVARVIGGGASQESIDAAGEAIQRGYSDWQAQKFWRFLLKDTSGGFRVASCVLSGLSGVVSAPSVGTFDGVNIGVTVTGTGVAASTTVLSFVRGADGVITTITLSSTPSAGTVTLTFSGDIPIIAGTNEYNLPTDYNASATARTLTIHRALLWRSQEYWDRVQPDQTLRGSPGEYTTYNPLSEVTQNFGETRLKFDLIPDTDDTLSLRYFREFNTTGTYVDLPDEVLYKFLDYCRSLLLEVKRAHDDPAAYRDSTLDAFQQAQQNDESSNSESDLDDCIKSQFEMGSAGTPLWRNGDFDQYRS